MKTGLKNFTGVLLISLVFMVSCEKSEYEPDYYIEEDQEEGFLSETGENDSEIETTLETIVPLLHKRYDGSLSKEEASALFAAEVSKFQKESDQANKASYFYFQIETRTSNYAHSQTDANVWARANFLTDKGPKNLPWFPLNNAGDDRQNGAWDFYYFGTHASSISWLEAKSATVALQGTDGWHVKYFDLRVYSWKQSVSASGNTRAISNPEIWLDNITSTGWDYYSTGNVGTGRTTFN